MVDGARLDPPVVPWQLRSALMAYDPDGAWGASPGSARLAHGRRPVVKIADPPPSHFGFCLCDVPSSMYTVY